MTLRSLSRLLLGLTISPAACATGNPTDAPEEPRQLTVQEQLVANANQRFGLKLLAQRAHADPDDNIMISPLSVSMALGMTMNGAAGSTFDELRATLGFEQLPREQLNTAYQGLLAQLRLRDERVTFTIANSVWYSHAFAVKSAFLEEARTFFGADVRPLDFLDPAAPDVINDWVKDATSGRIPKLIERIGRLDRLFLINAMYFKAPWAAPFEKAATHAGPFTRADGRVVQAELMRQDGAFRWHQDEQLQVAELLYADSAYSMLLVAPRTGSLAALVSDLTTSRVETWLGVLEAGRVLLVLPKFRFSYGSELRESLQALGIHAAFDPERADLSGINSTADDLHVSSVIHKTFIAVDEEGTEAAAATSVTIGVTSLPPTVAFDRPFLFLIRERSSGTILFAGMVRDPTLT